MWVMKIFQVLENYFTKLLDCLQVNIGQDTQFTIFFDYEAVNQSRASEEV